MQYLNRVWYFLRSDVRPRRRCNFFPLRRLFKASVLQPADHVELEMPVAVGQVYLVSPQSFCYLLDLGCNWCALEALSGYNLGLNHEFE